MIVKKLFLLGVVGFYMYSLAFNIFMTDLIRIPAPLICGILLLPFIKSPLPNFVYFKETALIAIGLFLYNGVGMGDFKSFFALLATVLVCVFYFNFYVGLDKQRFNTSVILFYSLLFLSMIILVLDHYFQGIVDPIRSMLLGEQVQQSPSGIAVTQFNFGYQVGAFTGFVFVAVCVFKKNFLIKATALGICLTFLYLGMNRSAFVCFAAAILVFVLLYYRIKALFVVAALVLVGFAVYTYVLKDDSGDKDNILAKNEAKGDDQYKRSDMALENLKICADYPFGLIFYGKTWEEATYRHPLFAFGLSSHNAYLMFLTYLGPFLGFGLLIAIYYRIMRLFKIMIHHVRLKENALLVALFFSFITVFLNALSHNGWLLSVDGPTLFLYFSTIHLEKIYVTEAEEEPVLEMAY